MSTLRVDTLQTTDSLFSIDVDQLGIITDLTNESDSAKGASLVGWKRSAGAEDSSLGDLLRRTAIQLLEYIPEAEWPAIKAGTSTYDATANVQEALDYAASQGQSVVHDVGTVSLDCVRLNAVPGLKGFFGRGTLKSNNVSTATGLGILQVYGSFHSNPDGVTAPQYPGATDMYIGELTIDCNGGNKRGVFASSLSASKVMGLTVSGMSLDSPSPNGGIRFNYDCSDNLVANNTVSMAVPADATIQTCYGIQFVSELLANSGWGTGAIVPATHKCSRNIVVNNRCTGGTHGISLSGGDQYVIANNYLYLNAHRSIHLNTNDQCEVIGNQCLEPGSAGIILGYGCNRNNVVGNNVFGTNTQGEGGIVAYVGSGRNIISGNKIRTGGNYGIYLAIDVNYNTVMDNEIDGAALKKAALCLQSDWIATYAPPFNYSPANYAAPPSPKVTWATGGCTSNVFKNNRVYGLPANTVAVYFAQVGTVGNLDLNAVLGNDLDCISNTYSMYFPEATSGMLLRTRYSLNTNTLPVLGKDYATRGRAHFIAMSGNDTLNGDLEFSIGSGTTPSAFESDSISLAAYAAPTNIATFVNGRTGQKIRVRIGTNITLVHNTGLMNLKGGVNAAGVTNGIVQLENRAGVWYEVSRNF